jgi:hypothetical protein
MSLKDFERYFYPAIQIFGGGSCWMNAVHDLAVGPSLAVVLFWAGLVMFGTFNAIVALRFLDGSARAAKASCVCWAIQIPYFTSSAISFSLCAGASAGFALEPATWKITGNLHLGLDLVARVYDNSATTKVGISILAVLATRYFFGQTKTMPRR